MCPPSVFMEADLLPRSLAGPSRVASGPPSACASSPFEALKQGRLGMINGPAERHAPRPRLQTPSQLPCCAATRHSRLSDSAVCTPTHNTLPQCHLPDLPPVPLPLLPQKSIKELCSGGISSFGWYHPPCCAVDTGVFLLEDKGAD